MKHLNDDRDALASNPQRPMKVIAAGLPRRVTNYEMVLNIPQLTLRLRCATTSLMRALESDLLDCFPTIHMKRVVPWAERSQLVIDALREEDKGKRQKILHKLFDGYATTCDFPGCAFTADLMDMYPDAKIILNQRADATAWGKSVDESLMFFSSWAYRIATYLIKTDRLNAEMQLATFDLSKRHLGFNRPENPEAYKIWYSEYNKFVRDEARKRGREVLEWQPRDGWEPICKFLDKPMPPASVPFPHCNDKQAMARVKVFFMARGLCYWALLCAGVLVTSRLLLRVGAFDLL